MSESTNTTPNTRKSPRAQAITTFALVAGILLVLNIVAYYFRFQLDLTEEKRYTITQPTKDLLKKVNEVVYVKVLLEGEFPAGFKRLQTATLDLLEDFKDINGNIEYEFYDPAQGTPKEINERREDYKKQGILPINLRMKDVDETKELIIYPWAILSYKGKQQKVNLLEGEVLGMSNDMVLNNSIALLEYKLANGIQKLVATSKPTVAFLEGQGEMEAPFYADFRKSLDQYFQTWVFSLDSLAAVPKDLNLLIVNRPTQPFDEKTKYKLDQYVMHGGKVIWMVDKLLVNLDSLRNEKAEFIPKENDLKLDDLLFQYGVRLQPNIINDLQCSRIPLVTGRMGSGNQYDMFPCFYHPTVIPMINHPVVKSIDRVQLYFPSSMDTIKTATPVVKTILLQSSKYSKLQFAPVRLNLEVFRYDPVPEKFNKPHQNVAVLLEGEFGSLYEGRVTAAMQEGLDKIKMPFVAKSVPTKQLVISDGDVIRNLFDPNTRRVSPTGYNTFERHTYGNKEFMLNAIEYMLNDGGIIAARSKEVIFRPLDVNRARNNRLQWQLLNVGLPIALVLLFGFLFHTWRNRRWTQLKTA